MASAGYDIAASFSMASTQTSSVSQAAYTVFNFSSPYATGGNPSTVNEPNAPATATSSTNKGSGTSTAQVSGTGLGSTGTNGNAPASSITTLIEYALLAAGGWLLYKHFKKGGASA